MKEDPLRVRRAEVFYIYTSDLGGFPIQEHMLQNAKKRGRTWTDREDALFRDIDFNFFDSLYIASKPFFRIPLREFWISKVEPLSVAPFVVGVRATVFCHGVVSLVFSFSIEGEFSAEEIIHLQRLNVLGIECDSKKTNFNDIWQSYLLHLTRQKESDRDRLKYVDVYPAMVISGFVPEVSSVSELKTRFPRQLSGIFARDLSWEGRTPEWVVREIERDINVREWSTISVTQSSAIKVLTGMAQRILRDFARQHGSSLDYERLLSSYSFSVLIETLRMQTFSYILIKHILADCLQALQDSNFDRYFSSRFLVGQILSHHANLQIAHYGWHQEVLKLVREREFLLDDLIKTVASIREQIDNLCVSTICARLLAQLHEAS